MAGFATCDVDGVEWIKVPNNAPCQLCWSAATPRSVRPPRRKTHNHCPAIGCAIWCNVLERARRHMRDRHPGHGEADKQAPPGRGVGKVSHT